MRFHLMMGMYFGIAHTVMAHEMKGIYQYPEAYERHLYMASGFYSMPGVRQWWDGRGRDLPAPHIILIWKIFLNSAEGTVDEKNFAP